MSNEIQSSQDPTIMHQQAEWNNTRNMAHRLGERARRAHSVTRLDVVSHLIGSSPRESCHKHLHSHPCAAHSLSRGIPVYFHLFFPVFFSILPPATPSWYPEAIDNLIVMDSLCYSANKGSDDACDVSTSLTICRCCESWCWE